VMMPIHTIALPAMIRFRKRRSTGSRCSREASLACLAIINGSADAAREVRWTWAVAISRRLRVAFMKIASRSKTKSQYSLYESRISAP
jgi:hypothetical protein